MTVDKVLDAKGLQCPMPLVQTRKAMNAIESGQILEIHTTDKGSKGDLNAWAKLGGHEFVKHEEAGDVLKL